MLTKRVGVPQITLEATNMYTWAGGRQPVEFDFWCLYN